MKDNKLAADSIVKKFGKMLGGNEDLKNKLVDSLNKCASITDADRCEAAAKITECVLKEVEAHGLKLF